MPTQVAIIGAGITGLTAGILLKEQLKDQDYHFTIYEQRASIESIGGGLTIWPNGAQVLMDLPCASDIKKLAGYFKDEHWGNASGDTLRVVDRDLLLEINGSPFMNICRSELQHLLLNTFGKEDVIFKHKIRDIEKNDQSAILYFNNGEQVQADLVIGADGTYSTIRKLIFPEAKLNYAGYIALVGIYDSSNVKAKHNVIWGKNRLLLNFPISRNRHIVYAVMPLPKDDLKNKYPIQDQQFALFYGWSNEADIILTALKNSLQHPEYASHYFCSENYDMFPLSALHQGNIVLIGDAAHPMGSIMGLNANVGLKDAKILAYHLSQNKNIPAALKQFSQENISHIQPIFNLENQKKAFLLEATDISYNEFTHFARFSSHGDFFSALYAALRRDICSSDQQLRGINEQ